jgi:hypothetical protein
MFVDAVSLAVTVNSSFPTQNGWTVVVNNSSGASDAFRVAVTCTAKPAHYVIVSSKPVGTPSPHRTTVSTSCPTSTKPLGGGALSNGSTSVDLGGSRPFRNGWRITEENLTATLASRVTEPGPTVKAFAVCGSVPGYRLVTGNGQTVLPTSQATVTATCPTGSVVLGGGASVTTSSIGVNFNASGPDEQTVVTANSLPRSSRIFAWQTIVNDNNEVPATAAPFAICAGP